VIKIIPKEDLNNILDKKKEWKENILSKFLSRGNIKEEIDSPSGIPLKLVYGPEDLQEFDYLKDLGFPGDIPFTRGPYPTMYRGRLWTMRQYGGFGDALETNERFKYLISQGQKGLSVAFDLPTQMGYNSDNGLCVGEVGRVGVTINSLKDFEKVFEGIDLGKISTSMTINAPTAILLAMYIAVGEKQGVKPEQLTGTVQNDILKEYVARGAYIFPPKPSMRLTADVIEYCSQHLPRFNTISISGYHMREAGANAVQEVAFTLANGIAYIDEVLKRGINVDEFAPRLSFFFITQKHFFEEVAKLRAARRLWTKIMRDRYGATDPNSLRLRFHTQTAGTSLTAQQPHVNIIRIAIQALAAILGGAQSLHACGFDEALAIPTEESVQLSLRTQQVIAYESGVSEVIDPIGGSYYLEYLTTKIEEEVVKYIEKINDLGGMVTAIENGYIQKEIAEKSYIQIKNIDEGDEKVIGVNVCCDDMRFTIDLFKIDESSEKKAIESLEALKEERNNDLVKRNLEKLKGIAQSSENLMPILIDTVKNYATMEEICDILREVFGKYQPPQII
jgi:methylmalonyl-CoA mutase N-terminal domain/subunit